MAVTTHKIKAKNAGRLQKAKKDNPPEPFPDPLPSPMLAKLVTGIMDNPDWIYEMKLDGYRMLCQVKDGRINLVSRRGNSYTERYKGLMGDLSEIADDVILDGEVVAENEKGLTDFQLLQNYGTTKKGKLKYYVFDMLYLNGHNIMDFPLLKRKELLDAFFSKYDFKKIIKLKYQVGQGKKMYEELSSAGYEGVIAKDPESVYMPGKRNEAWLKIKATKMQQAVLCGYTEPQGSRKYFGSIILGLYENDVLKYIGNCGTGFSESSLKELHRKFTGLVTTDCPFPEVPGFSWAKGIPTWLKPQLIANIKFMDWSNDGMMRAPVFMGLRDDKDASDVINESKEITSKQSFIRTGNDSGGPEIKIIEETASLSGKKVKLTNPGNVYWPAEGYTKGDLISYYVKISKYILPYLTNRPQSLNRHPDGIKGPGFYHKDMDTEQIPAWARTVKLESKSNEEGIDYLICNDVATLVYMANLGCIEINPWHSTYLNPENPDYLMLDLDPGNISFTDVVNTALVIRELCQEIDIPCYCKTSGATGLHIYVPVGANYSYEQVKTFAGILAGIAHRRLPSTTSIERKPAKRMDKVYIDFLQNRKAQTIAAPYSVRPRPLATVSAPLEWNEVNHQLTPEMFTMKNMLQRLEKKGDLWQAVLGRGISLSKALRAVEKLQ